MAARMASEPDPKKPAPEEAAYQRPLSLRETASAVLWSFLGIRKRRDYARDAARLNPVLVIVMGVVGAALFVLILITIVTIVVHH